MGKRLRENFEQVRLGMTEAEVQQLFGPAQQTSKRPRQGTRWSWFGSVMEENEPVINKVRVDVDFGEDRKVRRIAGEPVHESRAKYASGPYDSPQSAYTSFAGALSDEEWGKAFNCLTPEAREAALGNFIVQLQYAYAMMGSRRGEKETAQRRTDELDAIVKAHKVSLAPPARAPAAERIRSAGADARTAPDPAALFADLVDLLHQDAGEGSLVKPELEDVKITGETASGTEATTGSRETIKFRKTSDGWQIELDQRDGAYRLFKKLLRWRSLAAWPHIP